MASFSTLHVFFLMLSFFLASSSAEYLIYRDPRQPLDARIGDLMSRMTFDEKIGQMTQIAQKVASPEIIKNYHIGKNDQNPIIFHVIMYMFG